MSIIDLRTVFATYYRTMYQQDLDELVLSAENICGFITAYPEWANAFCELLDLCRSLYVRMYNELMIRIHQFIY